MKLNSKIKKIVFSFLTAACISTAAFGVAGCMPKSVDKSEPTDKNVRNARLAPPTDGSLPTAYSAVENLAYIVGKFDSQTQYHSYTEGVTVAAIATQTTKNWKDYKDGVLVNSDITFSSMVKGGTQSCTVFGKDEEGNPLADTYFRTSETPNASTTSTSAVWKQDAPTYFSESGYLYTYGFLPNELFNYAVNSDTVISADEIKVESNGTYSLTFTLDPKGSTFFYQFGMKTRGGLSDYPDFEFIEISLNFNADWQINTCDVHEVSKINKGIVVSSVSDFTTVYYYGEDHFDNEHFGYYNSYYKKYLGDGSLENGGNVDDELVMDVTNVLSNGFATVLNGGQQFEISANLGNNKYVGYVFLGLDLADIAGSINVKASLGKTLDTQNFYVEFANGELSAYYGEDFGLYANLAAVKLETEKFGEVINKITQAVSRPSSNAAQSDGVSDGAEESASDPLTELMNSMVLVAGENQATLTLKTDDLLGLGIGIDANLVFGISGNTITFRGADIGGLSLGGETLDLNLGLKTTTAPLISRNPQKTPADLADYVADIYSLLNSDLIKVSAELNGDAEGVALSALKGVNVKVDAYADLGGIAVGADASASYTYNGNTISAKINVIYEYNQNTGTYGNAYLSLKELNGAKYDLNVRCDIKELVSGISALLNTAGAASTFETGKLVSVLNSALSANFSSLLTEMYADNAKIKIGVSVDTILDMLGVNAGVKFGSCELTYAKGEGANGGCLSASLPSIGFNMGVCGVDGELETPNDEDYLDLYDILTDIKAFIDVKTVAVGLSFDGSQFTAISIPELADLTATATIYADLNSGVAAKVVAEVKYGNITAKLTADYIYDKTTYGTVVLTLNELCGEEREVKIYCQINEVIDGVKTLLSYFGTAQTATETTNGGLDLNAVIASLLTADINAIIPNLEAKANVLNLSVNVDEVLKLLNVNLGNLTVGEVALNYTHGGENLLSLNAPNFGVVATVNPYNGNLEEVTTSDALNLKDVLDDVNAILNSKKLAVNLTFNGADFTAISIPELADLTANATIYADLNSGIAAKVVAEVAYGNITAKLTADYVYDKTTYGTVVLTLNELCGVEREVKVYCQINEVIDGVKTLLSYFGTAQTTAETSNNSTLDLNAVISSLLTADINAIIPNLEAKANVLNLSVNVDEALKLLNVSLGNLSVGEVALSYTHGGENLLSVNAPNFGVVATVNPYNANLEEVTTADALNLKDVLDDVNAILNSKKLAVALTFNGADFTAISIPELADLTATATIYADLNSGVAAKVVAEVKYGNITAKLTADYIYDKTTYGTVVLTLNELCGVEREVKVYCQINEVIDGVKTLLSYFGTAQTTAETSNNSTLDLNAVIASLLTADINAIIPNLEAKANVLNLSVNVDEVLKLLNVNLGNLSIGEVALNYTHGGENLLSLNAPNFGVVATVNPYNGNLEEVTTSDALNLKDVLDDVNSILSAKKLAVNLTFNGADFSAVSVPELADLTATATIYADLNSGIAAKVVAEIAYGEITAKITADYIYDSATYGTVVLTLNELCGVEREVKVYCQINEVIDGVKTLLSYFGTAQTTSESTSTAIDLNAVIASLLTADINAIIPNLEAKANVLNLSVNVDEVLKLLNVNLGNLSVGEVALNYTHGGENLLSVNAPNFGVVATVNPYNGELPEATTSDALNLKDVLDDVNAILNSKKLAVNLTFNGADFTAISIPELADLTATATIYADLNSGIAAKVVAEVKYGNITAKLTADYIYDSATYGTVVLTLNELCGVEREVNVYCQINEVIDGVKTLLSYFGTTQTTAEISNNSTLDLNAVIASLLTADINALIPNLEAKANVLNLSVNVDEVLKLLNVSLGNLSVGEVALNYTHGGENLLSVNAPNFGVVATVNPYSGDLPEATTSDALNLKDVLDDVNALLNSKNLAVNLTFNGADFTAISIPELADLTATATIYADLNSGIAAKVIAEIAYGEITAKITADYIYDKTTYGTVVLTLNELCGVEREVKLYCQINEVIDGVKTLLSYFGTTQTTAETSNNSTLDLNAVISSLLTADINALIPNLEAKSNVLNLSVNVDEVLKLLNVSLGNLSVGEVALNYTHGGENLLSLNAPNFGVVATVNPYNANLEEATTSDALNLKDVLDDVNAILNSKKLAVNLTFNGADFTAISIPELADLTATATIYADLNSGIAAKVVAEVAYGNITAKLTADYIYDKTTYGTVVLTLNELCGVEREVKLYCQVSEVIDGVKTLLSYFGTTQTATTETTDGGLDLNAVIASLLTADINAIIPNLEAKANVLNLSVNVDEVLKLLNVSLGNLSVGEVALSYTHGGENLLSVNAPNFGVVATVNPYNGNLEEVTTADALNLKDVLDDVNAILNSKKLAVNLTFNGANFTAISIPELADLTATATIYADLNSGIAAQVIAEVAYGEITAKITADYIYDQATYGKVVLTLNELCGEEREVKLYCQINEVIDGVKTLLSYFGTTQTTAETSNNSALDLNAVIASLLTADINALIPNLEAKANVLNLSVNVDEVLKLLNVNLGNLSVGEVALNYTHGGENLLSVNAPNFGVVATVNPYNGNLEEVTTSDALNLKDVLDDVNSILSAKKLAVNLTFNGANFSAVSVPELADLTANATIYADLNSGIAAKVVAEVKYGEITAKLTADYVYDKTTYGTVVLTLNELCGVEREVKVYCQINEVIEGVKTLLSYFGTAQTTAETSNNSTLDLNAVISSLLTADINSIIPNLEAKANVLNLSVNVDEVLKLLNVSLGNLSVGEVALSYTHGGENLLSVNAPNFGLVATVNPYNVELPEVTTADALNLKDVLDDVNAILNSKKLAVNLTFNGANFTAISIPELADLTATATIYADLNSGIAAKVVAEVAYGNITAKLTADYIYDQATYGKVVLTLNELCGVEREVKLYCQVSEVIEGVKTLLSYFGTAQTATTETTNGGLDLNAVISSLLTADINAIIPNLEAQANVLNLSVNVDEVLKLLNVNLGNLSVGEVALNYTHGGENLLSLNAPNFGVVATVNPYNANFEEATTADALNLKDVLDDVNAILNSKKLAVNLTFNGANFTAISISELADLTATATIYADLNSGIAAYACANVAYKVDENASISASIKVYFNYDKATIGDVIVVLDSINGVETSAKVCCNVSELKTAIETLLSYVSPKNETVDSKEETAVDGATQTAASVLDKLINADINLILKEIKAGANVLNLTVNVDEILKLFDLELGLTLGDATLEYTHAQAGESVNMLSASLENFGVALSINPTNVSFSTPAKDDCLDLTQLLDVVNSAISQINTIKNDGKLYFEIAKVTDDNTPATYLYLDGIRVQVWGKGEISWAKGAERVALDLGMSISETGTDEMTLKLIYDKNSDPIVKLALNNVGLTIYNEDIENVKNGFIEIYNKLAGVFGLEPIATGSATETETTTETATETTQTTDNSGSLDKLLAVIFNILASEDWVNELNNFTATCNNKAVVLGYLTDDNKANVTINTDGGLSIAYDGAFGERFSLGGLLKVTAANAEPLEISFADCNMASSKDGETEFIRLAYNFLFESIHGISVENILGSNTYEVKFELNGANTEVAELKDVYVKAEIYVTDEVSINNGKLAEGLLVLDVAGVAINLHVITEYDDLGKAQFYINLNRVADILLPDLKMKATQDSLYETFKVLFNTLNDTNVLDVVKKLLPAGGSTENTEQQQPATEESQPVSESTLDKVAEILDRLLNLNFSESVNAYEIEGVQYADINLDSLLGQLGLNVGTLGNLAVKINHNDHSMTTSGVATVTNANGDKEDLEWISLSSAKTEKRGYSEFKREDYLNIEFLPIMLEDIVKFATDDNGNMYEKFTLSGSITANIVNMFDINIDVSTLTISLADNDFYFSGVLHVKKMSALGLVTIPESTVGISFHGGYLTLARGLNTSTPEYRIMTMDYFMDHMLVKSANDSVLKWWLNVSGWDTVISIINFAAGNLNVSSGLTTPEDIYLYDQTKKGETQLISMYDYVEALKVMVNGTEYASFGDMSALENEFGVYDNYYGFSLNARKVTGDVLTKLYAAIIRNDNGISAVKASGAIQSYVTFAATLEYDEGATQEYVFGTALARGVTAPSMFAKANEIIDAQGIVVDYDHFVKNEASGYDETFGCLNLTYNSNTGLYDYSYNYSNILYQHTLTIVNLDGTTETRQVRQGSTIYTYDNNSPAYTDETKEFRLLYTLEEGVLGATSVVMNSDLTVYALRAKAVNVIMTSGSEQYVVTSFVGDRVPTTIKGLETIGAVTYEDGTVVGENDYITEELINGVNSLKLSGVFVQSLVEVDGVNYEFHYDNATNSGYYVVAGKSASFDHTLYCGANGKTLVLKNEIGGYPVTAIAAEAFANTDGHALRSVIVPEYIVTIGERAFLDNVGMESAVFLAPQVTMLGSFSKGEGGNTTPFYGCSATTDGTSTNISVYYNSVVYEGSSTNLLWTRFRRSGSGAIFKRYYIGCDPRNTAVVDYDKNGGGALYSSGWDYVTANAVVELNGVTGSSLTVNAVEDILSRYYPLVSASTFTGSAEIESNLAVDFAQFDMTKNGITYKCVYEPEYNVVNGYTTVTYTVKYEAASIITVYSGVEFTFHGKTVKANTATKVTVSVKNDSVSLETPTATGYTFLGFAYSNGETLTFGVGEDIASAGNTLYVIWGASKVGTAFSVVTNTAGSTLYAPSGSGIDGKWYDNSWNEVTSLSLDNLVVYTRTKFTFTYGMSGAGTRYNDTYGGKNNDYALNYSNSFTVWEGQCIVATRNETKKSIVITVDGVTMTTMTLNKFTFGNYTWKDNNLTDGVWTNASVNGNSSVTFKY